MKVAQLARFLDSLVHGLDGVIKAGDSKDFRTFTEAMQPFSNASVAEFTAFLDRFGAEFQQTGKITAQGKVTVPAKPKPDAAQKIASAVAAIKNLFAEIDLGTVDDRRVEHVLQPYAKFTVPQLHQVLDGLNLAEKPKQKPKILDKLRQVVHHQMESRSRSTSVGGMHVPTEAIGAGV